MGKLTEKAIMMVKDFTKNQNFNKFSPFYHGTSTYNYRKIKENGLCPRGERSSVWGSGSLKSRSNLVYLANCGETQIPHKSAWNAVDLSTSQKINDFRHRPTEELEKELEKTENKIYLRLDNISPFEQQLVPDEDECFECIVKNSIYNTDFEMKNDYPSEFCGTIDKQIVDAFDLAWYEDGYEGVKRVIEAIPPTLKSIYSNGTIAIKDQCISPTKLTPLTEDEFYQESQKCPSKQQIESPCTKEERDLKHKLAFKLGVVRSYRKQHPEVVEEYKQLEQQLRNHIKKKFHLP